MDLKITSTIGTIFLLQWIQHVHGIIGYDCGSMSSNITTISLLNIGDCDIPKHEVKTEKVYLQLMQAVNFRQIKVFQCKVEIERSIKRCGMFSHVSEVQHGIASYIEETSRKNCETMHKLGSYNKYRVDNLRINHTFNFPDTLAGTINNNGVCTGAEYKDIYGTWQDVVVLAHIKITLHEHFASVNVDTNQIILASGVRCELKNEHCSDIEWGDTFWYNIPERPCKEDNYDVIYEGYANKITSQGDESRTIYSVEKKDMTFALSARDELTVCQYELIRTEHPKLYINVRKDMNSLMKKPVGISTHNMDIFAYINSKFVYVEKHFYSQMDNLYLNVLKQQCQLEQKVLKNALAIATQSPDIFAYYLMKEPGYTSVLAGEVVHIIKCQPVEVKVSTSDTCYNQLPVLRGNISYYLTPQTHLLLRQGTEIKCNSIAPVMYRLENSWYKLIPKPIETLAPSILQSHTTASWKYSSPEWLASSGIYTEEDLENLSEHIMTSAEQTTVLNTLARGVMGQKATITGGSIANLLDSTTLEKIVTSTWNSVWSRFLRFGNMSAGIFGAIVLIRLVKLIIDTVIQAFALHSVYGCSGYMLGALWNSITQLLLQLEKQSKVKGLNSSESSSDLREVRSPNCTMKRQKNVPVPPPKPQSWRLQSDASH